MMKTANIKADVLQTYLSNRLAMLLIFVSAFLLYANTLTHDFTQDDAIVIYQNEFVKRGVSGIDDIFAHDTFRGFFKEDNDLKMLSGGRYRPLTVACFAVIWELFGERPIAYHFLAVLIFALLGVLIFKVTYLIAAPHLGDQSQVFSFLAAMIFVFHPIHTEVVANVKGLDETATLAFSMLALYTAIIWLRRESILWFILSCIAMVLALLSKESAAPFIILIPATLYYFEKKQSIKKTLQLLGTYIFIFIGYAMIRISVIGGVMIDAPAEMLNNPFIKVVEGSYLPFTFIEKWATIVWGLGKYIQLLFAPYLLTHDYYPRHVEVMNFADPSVIVAAIMNLCLILIAIIGLRSKSILSFLIFAYYATLALVSNIIFPIGTHISERFLFTPSVAFSLGGAYLIIHLLKSDRFKMWVLPLFVVVMSLYSVRTISRNTVWKDDYTLFTTDVQTSQNSAKVRNAVAGALLDKAKTMENESEKSGMILQAIQHIDKAIEIHPAYKSAHLLRGNAHYYSRNYDQAVASFENALRIDSYYNAAEENLFLALREGARYYGSQLNDIEKSIVYLKRAIEIKPKDYESVSLLGIAHGNKGNHRKALEYFEKAVEIEPNIARAYVNLGYAQLNMGEDEEAQISFQQAIRIDPKSMN